MTTPTPPSDRHRRLTCATGIDLERAQADGLVTTHDADEVRRFGDYLRAAGPGPGRPGFDRPRWIAALREHYPGCASNEADVDTLTMVIRRGAHNVRSDDESRHEAQARAILASPWLAAHVASAVAADRERVERVEALGCYDCGLEYGGSGWCDTHVPNDVWAKISPTGDEGGVLCLTCMARRVAALGLDNVPLMVTSGPWLHEPESAYREGWAKGHAVALTSATSARPRGASSEGRDDVSEDATLADSLLHPWDSATGREIRAAPAAPHVAAEDFHDCLADRMHDCRGKELAALAGLHNETETTTQETTP